MGVTTSYLALKVSWNPSPNKASRIPAPNNKIKGNITLPVTQQQLTATVAELEKRSKFPVDLRELPRCSFWTHVSLGAK